MVLNARSVFNKINNLHNLVNNVGPDICIISETWEREKERLDSKFKNSQFKTFSYFRKEGAPGGGAAIIFNENRYHFEELVDISIDENVENVWALCTPKAELSLVGSRVKRIAVGSYYISPRNQN